MISVPYDTLKAYITREADIIYEAYITRSGRNGYHCKRLLCRSKGAFCWKGCAKKMPLNQRALHRFGGNCTAISITWESMIYNYYFDIRQLHYFSYLRKSVLALKVPGCAVLPKTSRLMCFVMVFLI